MLTKKDQLKSNRLRPKPNQKNKGRIKPKDLIDKEFMSWVHDEKRPPCFSCGRDYFYNSEIDRTELHHIKEASTDPKNDREVIPLCGIECHRLGNKLSVHGTATKFRRKYSIKNQRDHSKLLYLEYEYHDY